MIKVITGVDVAKVKNNHFAMDRMKEQTSYQKKWLLKKIKKFIFVAAKIVLMEPFAMGLIKTYKSFTSCFLVPLT